MCVMTNAIKVKPIYDTVEILVWVWEDRESMEDGKKSRLKI